VITTVFFVLGVRTTAVLATSFLGFFTFLPCLFIPLAIAYLFFSHPLGQGHHAPDLIRTQAPNRIGHRIGQFGPTAPAIIALLAAADLSKILKKYEYLD
jgi:hypothetical protein